MVIFTMQYGRTTSNLLATVLLAGCSSVTTVLCYNTCEQNCCSLEFFRNMLAKVQIEYAKDISYIVIHTCRSTVMKCFLSAMITACVFMLKCSCFLTQILVVFPILTLRHTYSYHQCTTLCHTWTLHHIASLS